MIDGPGFCECQEFSRILRIRTGDGEIAVVHLIDHQVGRRLHHGPLVTLPPRGVRLSHIDDSTSLTIHADCLGEDTRTLALTDVEGIKLSHQVALHRRLPLFRCYARHLDGLVGLPALSVAIQTHRHPLGVTGCEK